MSISFKTDFSSFNKFIKDIEQIERKKKNMMLVVANTILRLSLECFEYGKDPDGRAWRPLKNPFRVVNKVKTKAKTLIDKSTLKNSMRYQIAGSIVEVGSSLVYAATHQNGSRSKNIPKRAFLPSSRLPDNWRKEVLDEVYEYIKDAF